ncbi:hypothetical protein G6L37_01710 [Agrobacterium rubi]|nr:hypothetical protein [Agrobacterium rubi]NTF24110.1 hypothetical protein [Agrobacterium rubi]
MKRILNTLIAVSIAASPAGAAGSDQYFFRYKSPMQTSSVTPPIVETEYGIGNDIVAYYVAPIGYRFDKKIPVATQDVVEWRIDTGDMPAGIVLDDRLGSLAGSPTSEAVTTSLMHGYDRSGNRIARAEVHFTVFEPVGKPALVDFYAHKGTYFFSEIPNPEGLTVHRWVPISADVPGMAASSAGFEGTPESSGTFGLAWRGYDYLGREIAFAYGGMLVQNGPIVEELVNGEIRPVFGDQSIDKARNESFNVSAIVTRSLGPVTYKLIPDNYRPAGLTFKSDTGKLAGSFDTFDTSASFRIEARDSYDGTTGRSTPFKLTTRSAVIDVSNIPSLSGFVGTGFIRKFGYGSAAPGAIYEIVEGSLPDGLSLDPIKGEISGTPTKTETQSGIVLAVSGQGTTPARSNPFVFRIYPEALDAHTKPIHVRRDAPFSSQGIVIKSGGSEGINVTSPNLDGRASLDGPTGVISSTQGLPVGNHDAYLLIGNGQFNLASMWQAIRVYNPLSVGYGDIFVSRNSRATEEPILTADSIIGEARFTIHDTSGAPLPSWLDIDPRNGRISAYPTKPDTIDREYGPMIVTLKDDQDTVDSLPFKIKVSDREPMTLAVMPQDVQRFVGNGYRIAAARKSIGTPTYQLTGKPANWPSTLRLLPDGWLTGRTTDSIGTVYEDIVITATDTEGYSTPSQSFDISVVAPTALEGLHGSLNASFEWTEGQSFDAGLPALLNGLGNLAYKFGTDEAWISITDAKNGTYSGVAPAAGTYEVPFTVADETDRAPAAGALSLKINERPTIRDGVQSVSRASTVNVDIAPIAGGTAPFSYNLSSAVPSGLTFKNGRLSGTPDTEGTYRLSVSATDRTGVTAQGVFTLEVTAPAPIELEYDASPLYYGRSGPNGVLKAPVIKHALGATSWKVIQGTLPDGVTLRESGLQGGFFVGIPTQTGLFPGVVVQVIDAEGRQQTATVDIVVTREGEISFPSKTFTYRVGTQFSDMVTATNTADPVTFSFKGSDGTNAGLVLNGSTGSITGRYDTVGSYPLELSVIDSLNRSAETVVSYKIIGALEAAAEDAILKQYEAGATAATSTANAIGPVSFSLHTGTLPLGLSVNPASGSIEGTTEDQGVFPGIVIAAKDSDGTSAFTEPLTITVTPREALVLTAPEALSLKQFSTATFKSTTAFAIPPVAYDITPDLPLGLVLDRKTGSISGSSDSIVPESVYTLTATDTKGGSLGTDVAKFKLSVHERPQLFIDGLDELKFDRFIEKSATFTAKDAIGGTIFSVTPPLPAGLTLDGTTGTISGTPSTAEAPMEYEISAVDSKGGNLGSAKKTVTISVNERPQLVATISDVTGSQYKALKPVSALPTAGTFFGAITYSVTPQLPAELSFTNGRISGTLTEPFSGSFMLTAVDSFGGTLGTSSSTFTITVDARAPLGIDGPDSHEFQQYFTGKVDFQPISEIGAVSFAIQPALPLGLSLDAKTGTISGTAEVISAPATYTLTIADAHDQFPMPVTISVGDRKPMKFSTSESQLVMLDRPYKLDLKVIDSVGASIDWDIVSGALPTGLDLDKTTGTISGTATDFGSTASVTIAAADAFGGNDERTFTFKVVQDGTPISITSSSATTRVGFPFVFTNPSASELVGNPTWTINPGDTGIAIDAQSGELDGTPTSSFSADVEISVTDVTGRVASKTIKVDSKPSIQLSAPSTIALTYNREPSQPVRITASETVGVVNWDVRGILPKGMGIDPLTGTLTGKPLEVGTFGPVRFTATDSLPGPATSTPVTITVAMNEDPMTLSVTNFLTKVGQPVATVAPTVDNQLGPIIFFSNDLAGTGLSIDPATGIISGHASEVADRYINVSVRDRDTLRVTSQPMRYQVLPLMQIGLPSQVTLPALTAITPVKPTRNYVLGTATWEPLDESNHKLPDGIRFDVTTGSLVGTSTEIGTFGPFTVSSTDSIGDRGTSNSFLVRVNPGAFFVGLAPATDLPVGIKRTTPYTYDFKEHLTVVGVDESELSWLLGSGSPPGLKLVDGVLSGIPALSGTFTFDVSASYEKVTAKRSYTITIELPEIALELAAASIPQAKRKVSHSDNSFTYDLNKHLTLKNIDVSQVTWSIAPITGERLPVGLTLANGVISGVATEGKGTYAFSVIASFKDATDEDVSATTSYSIEVLDEIDFAFNTQTIPDGKKRLAYSFDLSTLIDDASLQGLAKKDLAWSWTVDPGRNLQTTMTTVPIGLSISGSTLTGTPTNSGKYAVVVTASFDGRSASKVFALETTLQNIDIKLPAGLPNGQFLSAYSTDLKQGTAATNIPLGEIKWSSASNVTPAAGELVGLPTGLSLASNGVISGTASAKGTWRFQASAVWDEKNITTEHAETTGIYTITIEGISYKFSKIVAGVLHTCGITVAGGVQCWGSGTSGQLGNGAFANSSLPVDVTGLMAGVRAVDVGSFHTCALTTSGGVKCWGNGARLGTGVNEPTSVPVDVPTLTAGVESISVGQNHTCAVTSSGGIKCWGLGASGVLGNGKQVNSLDPVDVTGLGSGMKMVSAGWSNTCALSDAGGVKCWGAGTVGMANFGGTGNNSALPVDVPGASSGITAISTGGGAVCMTTSVGGVKCLGEGGQNGGRSNSSTAVDVPNLTSGVTALSTGRMHSCAVSSGRVFCWGANEHGNIGTGSAGTIVYTPVQTAFGITNAVDVTASKAYDINNTAYTCVVLQDGDGKCWGGGQSGKLGYGKTNNSLIPVPVGG